MSKRSAPATEAARRYWTRAVGNMAGDAFGSAAAEAQARLCEGLSRWIGAEGFRALVSRATSLAQSDFPQHEIVSIVAEETDVVSGVQLHGPERVASMLIAQLAAMIELLGRIIGEELAMHVVKQAMTPLASGPSPRKNAGDRNE